MSETVLVASSTVTHPLRHYYIRPYHYKAARFKQACLGQSKQATSYSNLVGTGSPEGKRNL